MSAPRQSLNLEGQGISIRQLAQNLSGIMHGFRLPRVAREEDENCVLLGYYAASSGNSLPTFRTNLSAPALKMGAMGCPETSVRNYHYWLRNNPEERSSLSWPNQQVGCQHLSCQSVALQLNSFDEQDITDVTTCGYLLPCASLNRIFNLNVCSNDSNNSTNKMQQFHKFIV